MTRPTTRRIPRNHLLLSLLILAVMHAHMPRLSGQPVAWQSVGPGGGGALFLPSFGIANSHELYVACDMSQLFHSTDLGGSWSQVDFREIQTSGTLGRAQFTSDPAIRYAITNRDERPRPCRSTDGGTTWRDLASDPTDGEAYSLFADPNRTDRVIVSSYASLYISTNGGATFSARYTTANNNAGLHIGGVFFDAGNIYVGTNAGLLVSNDGGASFAPSNASGIPPGEAIVSLAGARRGTTTRLFVVTLGSSDVYAGITGADFSAYRNIYALDVGAPAWTARGAGIPNGVQPFFVGMSPANADIAYVAGGGTASAPTVYKTTDGGATWTNSLRTTNNQNIATGWSGAGGDREWSYGEYALGFAVSPVDPDIAAITDLGFVHVTSDGGTSWRQAYLGTADQHAAGSPTPKGRAYHGIGLENTTSWQLAWADSTHMFGCFSDIRGIVSTDAGNTWGFGYSGHTMNSMYRIARHPATGVLYGATGSVHDMYQSTTLTDARIDGGRGTVVYSADKGITWNLLHDFAHPVVWVALDPANPNRLYASVIHSSAGGIYVSDDIQNGAASQWRRLASPPRTEGHPFNVQVLNDGMLVATYSGRRTNAFTASSGVFVSTDAGATWSDRSAAAMRYWTKDLVVDPHDASQNTWLVGVFSGWGGPPNGLGGLYRTTDRGATWNKIFDQDRVTSCTFNPANRNELYATTEAAGLWYSANAGSAAPTFTQLASYPFRQPERVFFNPYDANEVWVTSFGNGLRRGLLTPVLPPGAPVLLSPADNATQIPTAGTLVWSPANEANAYRVQLSTTEDFSSTVIDTQSATTSRAYAGLAQNTRYYWRARAINDAGPGPWSQRWSFTTAAPSSAVGGVRIGRATCSYAAASGEVVVGLDLPDPAAVRISITDIAGQRLRVLRTADVSGGRHVLRADAGDLASGRYFVTVEYGGHTEHLPILIVR